MPPSFFGSFRFHWPAYRYVCVGNAHLFLRKRAFKLFVLLKKKYSAESVVPHLSQLFALGVYMPTTVRPCSMAFPAHLQRFCTRPTLLAKHVFGVVVNLRSKDNGGHAK